jgi:hypothetical protein
MNFITFVKLLTAFLLLTFFSACSDSIPPPDLTGKYQPGAETLELRDGNKWIQVRIWYPSLEGSNNKLMASDAHSLTAFSEVIGLPEFLMGSEEASRSSLNVPIAYGRFPIIIFNHGLMSYARQNTSQFEQLASHGYIVFSIANPGESMVVVRDNGEVIHANRDGIAWQAFQKQRQGSESAAADLQRLLKAARNHQNFIDFKTKMSELSQGATFKDMLPLLDVVYSHNQILLNALPNIDKGILSSKLEGHLDLENIGVYGHSFGAIVSGQLTMRDARIKAAIGLDAPMLNSGNGTYKPFDKPVCFAYADALEYGDSIIEFDGINRPLLESPGSCEVRFEQSAHYNFTDLNQVTALRYSPMLGEVDNSLMSSNLEQLLLAFFNTHLKGTAELSDLKLAGVEMRMKTP